MIEGITFGIPVPYIPRKQLFDNQFLPWCYHLKNYSNHQPIKMEKKRNSYTVSEKIAYVKDYIALMPQPSNRCFAACKKIPFTSFCTWVREYCAGKYNLARSGSHRKMRSHKFAIVSEKFRKFMHVLTSKADNHVLNFPRLQGVANIIAQKYLPEKERRKFHASTVWIQEELKYGGFTKCFINDGENGDREITNGDGFDGDNVVSNSKFNKCVATTTNMFI